MPYAPLAVKVANRQGQVFPALALRVAHVSRMAEDMGLRWDIQTAQPLTSKFVGKVFKLVQYGFVLLKRRDVEVVVLDLDVPADEEGGKGGGSRRLRPRKSTASHLQTRSSRFLM